MKINGGLDLTVRPSLQTQGIQQSWQSHLFVLQSGVELKFHPISAGRCLATFMN
jgi:hypothetical protein